jgi:hypothetical protein
MGVGIPQSVRISLGTLKNAIHYPLTYVKRVLVVGNGLSIAANPGFALPALTTAVRTRLDAIEIGERSAREHLDVIGQRLEADGQQSPLGSNFERLIGPLDRLQGLIGVELGAIIGALRPDLRQPLDEVAGIVRALYTSAVGAVLAEVDALEPGAQLGPFQTVIQWATSGLGDSDQLAIYTVNYDPLLDRALLELREEVVGRFFKRRRYALADEFSGLPNDQVPLTLAQDTQPVVAFARRAEPFVRARAVDLIHLHGGQHWFRARNGVIFKATLNELRARDLYGHWTRGEPTSVEPAVVLTDQKTQAVLRSPFVDAYTRLRHDLQQADRVAIVGYGFGDEPLNARLRRAFGGPRPVGSKWLISRNTCPPAQQGEMLAGMAHALGLPPASLPEIVMRGLPEVATSHPDFFR